MSTGILGLEMTSKLLEALEASGSTVEFGAAVRTFSRDRQPNERVRFDHRSPPVKVERVLTQLLANHPHLTVRAIAVDGQSGCEFFRGSLTAETAGGVRRFAFHWDCRWKAIEEGWTDAFGMPDQIRAARTFGHDCFRSWEEIPTAATTV